jgi:hypothetical protein
MLESEINRAKLCISNLNNGASSFQKTQLPPCFQKNAEGIENFGKEVSDAVASWISKGFAAGPFEAPPPQRL